MLTKPTSSRDDQLGGFIWAEDWNTNEYPTFFTPNSQSYTGALEMWEEAQKLLPPATLELAQEFVDFCIGEGAFLSEPACHIEALDEGRVIFDWNDGTLPVFTVLITEQRGFVFSGISAEAEKKGKTPNLNEVVTALPDFVETGRQLWPIGVLQGSSLKKTSDLEGADLHPYTPQPLNAGFRFLQPMEYNNTNYAPLAAT